MSIEIFVSVSVPFYVGTFVTLEVHLDQVSVQSVVSVPFYVGTFVTHRLAEASCN